MKWDNADIVDLEHRIILVCQEFKPQICRVGCCSELDQIILESPGPFVASIHGVDWRMVDHYTCEPLALGTLVEVGSEPQVVRYTSGEDQILIDGCRVHVGRWGFGSHLVKLVGKIGRIAWGGNCVLSIDNVFSNPRRETTFEATISNAIVNGTRRCTRWSGRRG